MSAGELRSVIVEPQRRSCISTMLDLRGIVLAARQACANMEPAVALTLLVGSLLIFLCCLPIYWTWDLSSTWDFMTGMRDQAEPAFDGMQRQFERHAGNAAASVIVAFLATCFTLLPTFLELVFPSINHPLSNSAVHASIVFDYITDWPRAWSTTDGWTDNPVSHFIVCVGWTFFVSIFIQAIMVLCVTMFVFCVIGLLRGGRTQSVHALSS